MKRPQPVLLSILLFCITFVVLQLLASLLFIYCDDALLSFDFKLFASYTISVGLTLLFTTFLERWSYGTIKPIERKLAGFDPVALLCGVIVIIAISIVLIPLSGVLPAYNPEVGDGLLALITMVIIAPILEEIIFRGRLYNIINGRWSPLLSVATTSLIFGAVHLSPIVIINGFLAGFVFSYLYISKRSIIAPILLHMCNNALAYALVILSYNDRSMEEILADRPYFIYVYILAFIIVIAAGVVILRRLRAEKHKEMEIVEPSE